MCLDPFLCFLKNQPADHHRNRLPARYSAHAVLLSEIGYKLDAAFQHQGYAREAVTKVLNIAFTDLSLHRVFARVMPENTPSLRLLEAIGFTCEGTEYACTQIQGKWKDHIRYALLNPYSSI